MQWNQIIVNKFSLYLFSVDNFATFSYQSESIQYINGKFLVKNQLKSNEKIQFTCVDASCPAFWSICHRSHMRRWPQDFCESFHESLNCMVLWIAFDNIYIQIHTLVAFYDESLYDRHYQFSLRQTFWFFVPFLYLFICIKPKNASNYLERNSLREKKSLIWWFYLNFIRYRSVSKYNKIIFWFFLIQKPSIPGIFLFSWNLLN